MTIAAVVSPRVSDVKDEIKGGGQDDIDEVMSY